MSAEAAMSAVPVMSGVPVMSTVHLMSAEDAMSAVAAVPETRDQSIGEEATAAPAQLSYAEGPSHGSVVSSDEDKMAEAVSALSRLIENFDTEFDWPPPPHQAGRDNLKLSQTDISYAVKKIVGVALVQDRDPAAVIAEIKRAKSTTLDMLTACKVNSVKLTLILTKLGSLICFKCL